MQEAFANISQMSIIYDLIMPALQGLIVGLIVLFIVYNKQGYKKLGITGAVCAFLGGLTFRLIGAFIVGLIFVMTALKRKNKEAEDERIRSLSQQIDEMSSSENAGSEEE